MARRARTLDEARRAELALVVWMLTGCDPDDAMRRAQCSMKLCDRRSMIDLWQGVLANHKAHLAEVSRRIGANPDTLARQWVMARLLHAERIRELQAEIARRASQADLARLPTVTPERAARSVLRVGRAVDPEDPRGKHTVPVLVDDAGTVLRSAKLRGRITAAQLSAGERIAEIVHDAHGASGGSAFEWRPRGHSNASVSDWRIEAASVLRRVQRAVTDSAGADAWRVVVDVAGYDEPIGDCRPQYRRYRLLCAGLDAAVDLWSLGEGKAA